MQVIRPLFFQCFDPEVSFAFSTEGHIGTSVSSEAKAPLNLTQLLPPPSHSSDASPAHGGGGAHPRRHLGGQHGGAGGDGVVLLRPRRQHTGRPEPAARRAAARQDGRRVLQHAGGAAARPHPPQRGRREGGGAGDGAAAPPGQPSLRLAPGAQAKPEGQPAGEAEEHVHPAAAQPLLSQQPIRTLLFTYGPRLPRVR